MIFQQYRRHLLVGRLQPDHGVQTGLFASHWGNEETPPFTPREPVIAAGTRHDDGWKAWKEEHPTLDSIHGAPLAVLYPDATRARAAVPPGHCHGRLSMIRPRACW